MNPWEKNNWYDFDSGDKPSSSPMPRRGDADNRSDTQKRNDAYSNDNRIEDFLSDLLSRQDNLTQAEKSAPTVQALIGLASKWGVNPWEVDRGMLDRLLPILGHQIKEEEKPCSGYFDSKGNYLGKAIDENIYIIQDVKKFKKWQEKGKNEVYASVFRLPSPKIRALIQVSYNNVHNQSQEEIDKIGSHEEGGLWGYLFKDDLGISNTLGFSYAEKGNSEKDLNKSAQINLRTALANPDVINSTDEKSYFIHNEAILGTYHIHRKRPKIKDKTKIEDMNINMPTGNGVNNAFDETSYGPSAPWDFESAKKFNEGNKIQTPPIYHYVFEPSEEEIYIYTGYEDPQIATLSIKVDVFFLFCPTK